MRHSVLSAAVAATFILQSSAAFAEPPNIGDIDDRAHARAATYNDFQGMLQVIKTKNCDGWDRAFGSSFLVVDTNVEEYSTVTFTQEYGAQIIFLLGINNPEFYGTLISRYGRYNGYYGDVKLKLTPATVTSKTSHVTLEGTVENWYANEGCTVTIRGSYSRAVD